jgi:hypothetical protein
VCHLREATQIELACHCRRGNPQRETLSKETANSSDIRSVTLEISPELPVEWRYGYATALGLMVIAAVLPYLFFKWKKWL